MSCYTPRPWQPVITAGILRSKRVNMLAPMGSGKSAATLEAISTLLLFGEVRRVLRQIARDHVVDPWGLARRRPQAEGIDPFINVAPQLLGPFAGGGGVPLRPAPDGHPPLSPGDAVVEGEGPVA